jgi:hypothetical protein
MNEGTSTLLLPYNFDVTTQKYAPKTERERSSKVLFYSHVSESSGPFDVLQTTLVSDGQGGHDGTIKEFKMHIRLSLFMIFNFLSECASLVTKTRNTEE